MSDQPDGAKSESADPIELEDHHYTAGAVFLRMICDWDGWVERRVDSFAFAGDDERVLERRQSLDLVIPHELGMLRNGFGFDPTVVPVPITFVNKWRLPQFSLRDEEEHVVPLLARGESTSIAAAMLIMLANWVLEKDLRPAEPMSQETEALLKRIAISESVDALGYCAQLAESTDGWCRKLADDETFMSLAYELARGFPMIALLPMTAQRRRVLKFTYASYVVPARRDPRIVQLFHIGRFLRNRAWDYTETSGWRRRTDSTSDDSPEDSSDVTFSVEAQYETQRLRESEREGGIACALVTVKGPRFRSRTIRLRPNSAVRLHGLPPGKYKVKVKGVSGFDLRTKEEPLNVGKPNSFVQHFVAERRNVTKRVTQAPPRIAGRAWIGLRLSRAWAINNKPLAVRVRLGHGGSYHCEFEAPSGLHITRARLLSDVPVKNRHATDRRRNREIDIVLESKQRAHLYAPAQRVSPSAGYAYLHLRPRVETIGRSALLSALIATLVLAFIYLKWDPHDAFTLHGPEDASALLVLILGAPSALAAYFVQGIPSRVATSVLSGLRLAALVPSLLLLAAGAVMLVGQDPVPDGWPKNVPPPEPSHGHDILKILFIVAGLTTVLLAVSAWLAEHPREQARTNQGPGFQEAYSSSGQITAANYQPAEAVDDPPERLVEGPRGIRGLMLDRAAGMSQLTRQALLAQHTLVRPWHVEAAPALYFDSAETAPTFRGLAGPEDLELLTEQVNDLILPNIAA